MNPRYCLVAALCLTAGLSASKADEKAITLPDGNWILSYSTTPAAESVLALVKVENKGGRLTTSDLSIPRANFKVGDVSVKGPLVTVNFKLGSGDKYTFEGTLSPKDSKTIVGSFGKDQQVWRAKLTSSEEEKLEAAQMTTRLTPPEEYAEINKLRIAPLQLQAKLRMTKDDEEKAKLLTQIDAAKKEAEEKIPALNRTVIEKYPTSPAAFEVANSMLATAAKDKAKPEEVAALVKLMQKFSETYGPRFETEMNARAAETLVRQKGYEALTKEIAEKVAAAMPKDASAAAQVRVLKTYKTALENAGAAPKAKEIAAELVKLEEKLDAEYLKNVPPFKPETFSGRKGKADRVAVMELFTGAQCPPCVAADVAFDALNKAYKPTDLVLIQYHMHIPGPDPLTNLDSIARWDYYSKKFPQDIRGTPSTIFNGKPAAGGGGGMAGAEGKFKQYKDLIDPIIDEETGISLKGSASLKGDTANIKVAVNGVKDAADGVKVRFVLVEDTIRYVGSNGLRFHHHVVRSLPGGAEGAKVKDLKNGEYSATVDLTTLRKDLTKYLDTYAAETRPFPYPDRPLDLKHLLVIALVQDDETGKILQAAEFEVGGK